MSAVLTEVLLVVVLVLINGVFALSEMAIVSSRRVRLEQRAERGDAGARAALALAHEPTQFLSTVQVGITLIGILTGAFGGATIAGALAARLAQLPGLAAHSDGIALALVITAITYLSLILGELVPKRLALQSPERLAAIVARPMRLISRAASPLVHLLTSSTNLVFRLLRIPPVDEAHATGEEIRALIEQATESGSVEAGEQAIVEGAFRLGDLRTRALMRPRHELEWVPADAPPEVVRTHLARAEGPAVLVCRETVDDVVGVVALADLVRPLLGGQPLVLATLTRQPLFVPSSLPALKLIDTMRATGRQIAVVLDEFGGVEGLVSAQDIAAEVVRTTGGPGAGEADPIVERPDGSLLVDGAVPIQDLEAALEAEIVPDGERNRYQTVAGFVMTHIGHVPHVAEAFEWKGRRFEVVDMDVRRIDRVLVSPPRRSQADTAR